ncbi:MAG: bifunctional (p)ppGpp synthetase/guanosine-3',5'-bis(diphosphate) 3'-pyrophosphohydrolase [Hahellaceae bacterium]|nr:bifunctional (p)ppGpp synthetase/guanosine-3',5'-bis(diphosphate) 3'-pyrophosphohydrolase [Hahellaceae bacterium]
MPTIDSLAERLQTYLDTSQVNVVRRAYYYAEQAHEGQYRRSGEPYIVHPLAVAQVLADLQLDHQCLAAAMLHDVIEDTGIPKEAISAQFGEAIAELVDGVSKLTQIEFKSKAEAQAENFQKMTLAMARDIRVILVKLADRLHNMRTLGPLKPEKRRRIASETLDIYAPIANRLGIRNMYVELEDLGFQAMYPMRARYIQEAIRKLRTEHQEIISDIRNKLESALTTQGIDGRVSGREKHLNSIYRKMKAKRRSFQDIMDVYAFRIVTDTVDNCYRILGVVHSLFKPVPGRFKDYIAVPKGNGYQSLHTTLFGAKVNIEVQIRTDEMERIASTGVAAHWVYKGESFMSGTQQLRAEKWVQNLMLLSEQANDSLEFIEHVKMDLFADEIYVFTPKGRILELPGGATPLDFAYSIHTDIGNSAVACRINKHLSSLSVPLKNGQTVEVITAPGAKPRLAWLDYVVTPRAKSHIRHQLKQQKQSEARELGRKMLKKNLQSFGKALEELSGEHIARVLQHNQIPTMEKLYEDIGMGSRMSFILARQLVSDQAVSEIQPMLQSEGDKPALVIEGTEGAVLNFAHCCKPIPGDPIVGVSGSGNGLTIHSETCERVRNILQDPEQCIHLKWAKDITDEFSVALRIEIEKRRGMIAELASAISLADANIEKISVDDQNAKLSSVSMVIKVKGRAHLARVMRRLKNLKAVSALARVKH